MLLGKSEQLTNFIRGLYSKVYSADDQNDRTSAR